MFKFVFLYKSIVQFSVDYNGWQIWKQNNFRYFFLFLWKWKFVFTKVHKWTVLDFEKTGNALVLKKIEYQKIIYFLIQLKNRFALNWGFLTTVCTTFHDSTNCRLIWSDKSFIRTCFSGHQLTTSIWTNLPIEVRAIFKRSTDRFTFVTRHIQSSKNFVKKFTTFPGISPSPINVFHSADRVGVRTSLDVRFADWTGLEDAGSVLHLRPEVVGAGRVWGAKPIAVRLSWNNISKIWFVEVSMKRTGNGPIVARPNYCFCFS